jgi:hypothetical protein
VFGLLFAVLEDLLLLQEDFLPELCELFEQFFFLLFFVQILIEKGLTFIAKDVIKCL